MSGAKEGFEEGETATPGASTDVFISYASQDKAVADALVAALEQSGIKCWIAPRDVTPGEFYADAIVGAINATQILLLVLTGNSVGSTHVLREIERASAKRHPVVTFRMDSALLPPGFEYFLSASHWLDATTSGADAAMPELVEAVQRLLGRRPGVEGSRGGDDAVPIARVTPPPAAAATSPRSSRTLVATIAVIALVMTYLIVDKLWLTTKVAGERTIAPGAQAGAPAAVEISDKSVAVLPFVDMSEKKDQEYFSDGLSEELIDMLAKIPELRVPARTSSFYFKGKSEDIPAIGRRLLVAHVLEGSVRRFGRHLRVTAQLVRADNGYHLWSETYDRQMNDLFKVQDEIAGAVVKALKISLVDGPGTATPPTKNMNAYALYMAGRDVDRSASTAAEYERAAQLFRKSTDIDPAFAAAWFGLEIALVHKAYYTASPVEAAAIAEIRHVAERVVALDRDGAYTHQALAQVHFNVDWDWVAAAAEYRRAYELNPRDSENIKRLADLEWQLGRDDQAVLALYRKAIELDPVNAWTIESIASYYDDVGRFADEEAAYRKAIELNPTGFGLRASLGLTLLAQGQPSAGFAEIQREADASSRRLSLAYAYCVAGPKAQADAALEDAEKNDAAAYAYSIAQVHVCRGEIDQAFGWLDRAYLQRDSGLLTLRHDRYMRKLRLDPRFKSLLVKLKLPE